MNQAHVTKVFPFTVYFKALVFSVEEKLGKRM